MLKIDEDAAVAVGGAVVRALVVSDASGRRRLPFSDRVGEAAAAWLESMLEGLEMQPLPGVFKPSLSVHTASLGNSGVIDTHSSLDQQEPEAGAFKLSPWVVRSLKLLP